MDMQLLAEMTDADLLARVKLLAHNERRATAALVAHLAEIENRKLYLSQACASLFVYCTRVLHLSEHEAYNRIEAARAARRFPAVLASLEQGLVHLTAVRLLAPVLTGENHRELLAQATHKSKREIEELVARLRPLPDVAPRIRKLPEPKELRLEPIAARPPVVLEEVSRHTTPDGAPHTAAAHPAAPQTADAHEQTTPLPASRVNPAAVVPLAPERYKMQLTVSAVTREKLRRAQELLRHRIPDGDLAQVVDLALDLLVQDLEKKKFAAVAQPRTFNQDANGEPRTSNKAATVARPLTSNNEATVARPRAAGTRPSRHIPAAVKRAVWERDRGCCAYVSPNGDRCNERGGLEFDHIEPYGDGGGATAGNIRLLCRSHNQHQAREYYGLWQAGGTRRGPAMLSADEMLGPEWLRRASTSTRSGTS